MVNVAVLVSGGGTNLQALLDAEQSGKITHGHIALVCGDAPGIYALTRAQNAGVEAVVIEREAIATQQEYEAQLLALLKSKNIGLVVLAGFLQILSADFIKAYPDRIINVHPSLIPSFCGPGFYGLFVHEAALQRGVKLTGATVHLVNEITDGGRILLQKAVEVQENDTPETLQRRVMEQAEWVLLPQAVELLTAKMEG